MEGIQTGQQEITLSLSLCLMLLLLFKHRDWSRKLNELWTCVELASAWPH
jgi:hypothetical protein